MRSGRAWSPFSGELSEIKYITFAMNGKSIGHEGPLILVQCHALIAAPVHAHLWSIGKLSLL